MQGWFKLHRQLQDSDLWLGERFTRGQAWIDLIGLANHEPNEFYVRGNAVKVQRGELGRSILSLAERWKWNRRTVDKYLTELRKRKMVHIRKSKITTVITIANYDLYQESAQQTTQQNAQQSNNRVHIDKNDKKEKKEKSLSLIEIQAAKIYEHYASKARSGARADAIHNIAKLLAGGISAAALIKSIEAYAGNGMSSDPQYRIQANNFFGRKERWKEYEAKARGMSAPSSGPDPLAGMSKAELTALAQAGKLTEEQKAEAIRRGL